jgi:16S rRNA (guanine527-N7)-methyltransferase
MSLAALFSAHGFELSDAEVLQFEALLDRFIAYNSHTNLSAIRDTEGIIVKHFIDSLYGSLAYEMQGRILDIGSGGGFPGIPLKIIQHDLDITLLDSVWKKVKAMNYFVAELWLKNIHAIQERAEVLAKDPLHKAGYDIVTSRATAYITDILDWAVPFMKKDGRIILYKMPSPEEFMDRAKAVKKHGLTLESELKYKLADKDRVILVFRKK